MKVQILIVGLLTSAGCGSYQDDHAVSYEFIIDDSMAILGDSAINRHHALLSPSALRIITSNYFQIDIRTSTLCKIQVNLNHQPIELLAINKPIVNLNRGNRMDLYTVGPLSEDCILGGNVIKVESISTF